jgi:hypothetical protein
MTRVIHKTTPELTKYLWDEIPRELWGRARAKALTENRTMKVVLEELVRNWVDAPLRAPESPDPWLVAKDLANSHIVDPDGTEPSKEGL